MTVPDVNELLKEDASVRRRLDELAETQKWTHHAADLATGRLVTTKLNRPPTPFSRAQRLSRIGHPFGPTIFGEPSYRLTPRVPFIASPLAFLIAATCDAYAPNEHNAIFWNPPRELGTNFVFRGMRFFFAEAPNRRSLVTMFLTGKAFSGMVGHVRITAFEGPASISVPITDVASAHTVDLAFVPLGGRPAHVDMFIEAGVESLTFSSISFQAEPPVLDPGTL
jgi:hypothetical protein